MDKTPSNNTQTQTNRGLSSFQKKQLEKRKLTQTATTGSSQPVTPVKTETSPVNTDPLSATATISSNVQDQTSLQDVRSSSGALEASSQTVQVSP